MATVTKKIDDMNGEDADETVTFGYKGQEFTIDLSTANAELFEALMSTYVAAGTTVEAPAKALRAPARGKTTAQFPAGYLDKVRAWARDNGYMVSDKGRVKLSILEEYRLHNLPEKGGSTNA